MHTASSAPAALLLMDYQEAMCRRDGRVGQSGLAAEVEERNVLPRAANTLRAFRARGWPVVHVRVAFDPAYARMTSASPRFVHYKAERMLLETAQETAICSEVAPAPEEPVINKGCVNPFIGTRLQALLDQHNVDRLVLGGVATHQVVESTARIAADLGYRVIVLEDLCASNNIALHEFSVRHVLPSCGDVLESSTAVAALSCAS